MNKNLDSLKQELFDVSHEGILKYLIPVLEDFERRLIRLEGMSHNYYKDEETPPYGGVDNIIIRKGEN